MPIFDSTDYLFCMKKSLNGAVHLVCLLTWNPRFGMKIILNCKHLRFNSCRKKCSQTSLIWLDAETSGKWRCHKSSLWGDCTPRETKSEAIMILSRGRPPAKMNIISNFLISYLFSKKPIFFLKETHNETARWHFGGLWEAPVLYVSVQKEFSKRQSDR